jgi:hypothetical protein
LRLTDTTPNPPFRIGKYYDKPCIMFTSPPRNCFVHPRHVPGFGLRLSASIVRRTSEICATPCEEVIMSTFHMRVSPPNRVDNVPCHHTVDIVHRSLMRSGAGLVSLSLPIFHYASRIMGRYCAMHSGSSGSRLVSDTSLNGPHSASERFTCLLCMAFPKSLHKCLSPWLDS